MHLLRVDSRSIDGTAEAVDLAQTQADIVALSFTDTDLAVLAAAWEAGQGALPSLRLANLTALRHPYSVDLYAEKILSKARFVLVRLLGGMDYWRYGVDELATLARATGFHLAIIPGDHRDDPRLDEASTLPPRALRQIQSCFTAGGAENIGACLRFIASYPRTQGDIPPASPVRSSGASDPGLATGDNVIQTKFPTDSLIPSYDISTPSSATSHNFIQTNVPPASSILSFNVYKPGVATSHDLEQRTISSPPPILSSGVSDPPASCHNLEQPIIPPASQILPFGVFAPATRNAAAAAPTALIIFYRAWMLAADTAPVTTLADELAARGFRATAVYVTSLKDEAAAAPLRTHMEAERPDVILNLTAFSARTDAGASVLDQAGAPVFQLILSGSSHAQWIDSQRGLGPADLAMNVVLPEFDGRILTGAISFKGETPRNDALQFTRLIHQPAPDGISHAADLALAWAKLARTPRSQRRLACILSDYPAKSGRTGYAVGLDTPRSVCVIATRLAQEGFTVSPPPDEAALIEALSTGATTAALSVSDYQQLLATRPQRFVEQLRAAWGNPIDDPTVHDEKFRFRVVRAGNLLIAVQPDRGSTASRKTEYHDPLLPPRHGYVAFYLWLRTIEQVHAVIHCGTHGTLEWLPGKATALSDSCAPRAVLGPMPLIYPFIVNNPGEAAQAKRRTAAVTIGHLTPPLATAGTHGATAELEALFDEYAEAQSLDPRRATRLAELIMARAWETGLAAESNITPNEDPQAALIKLDAWLCDIKDMRIGDGLHVFGQTQDAGHHADTVVSLATLGSHDSATIERLLTSCAEAEMHGLLAALDGKFVPPGPAGAPARGRIDVLPTGRNLYSIDPRAVPTRTAWEIGRRTAQALLTRHAQDHGDWPQRIVLDLWGSATMRTGGDDLAQALALLGVRPIWDTGSNRVSGFDILPLAILNRPRVDVTLRISGLFRDVFPTQIELFDQAVRAVAALDEAPEDNPLAASGDQAQRIFGAAPGAYGIGLSQTLADGAWSTRDDLGEAYLQATSHAYGAGSEGTPAAPEFRTRVAQADAFVHVQDMPGQDVLDSDAFAEHEAGFAAAASLLGNHPALYHADTTDPAQSKIRTQREEVARVLRARATNPRWLAGQMRHGFAGAAEIAQTVDNVFAFAALADVIDDRQFDLLFDATLGEETIRNFLTNVNPAAASAIARRFDEAIQRGLWKTRRNSAASIMTAMWTDTE